MYVKLFCLKVLNLRSRFGYKYKQRGEGILCWHGEASHNVQIQWSRGRCCHHSGEFNATLVYCSVEGQKCGTIPCSTSHSQKAGTQLLSDVISLLEVISVAGMLFWMSLHCTGGAMVYVCLRILLYIGKGARHLYYECVKKLWDKSNTSPCQQELE